MKNNIVTRKNDDTRGRWLRLVLWCILLSMLIGLTGCEASKNSQKIGQNAARKEPQVEKRDEPRVMKQDEPQIAKQDEPHEVTLDEPQQEDTTAQNDPTVAQGETVDLAQCVDWAKTNHATIGKMKLPDTSRGAEIEALFVQANRLFRSSDFQGAEDIYKKILQTHPRHLGARNNLVLALVNRSLNEEALKQSLLQSLLHPEDDGNWVNIQIPLHALGYRIDDLKKLENTPLDFSLENTMKRHMANTNFSNGFVRAYAYNHIYADMEYPTIEDGKEKTNYNGLYSLLEKLLAADTDDAAYAELLHYLAGLTKIKTGLEPTKMVPESPTAVPEKPKPEPETPKTVPEKPRTRPEPPDVTPETMRRLLQAA